VPADGRPVTAPHPPGRLATGATGVAGGVCVFIGGFVGFFGSLLKCREENQTVQPRDCLALDQHPGWFAFGTIGIAVALPILGLLGVRSRWLIAIGVLVWVFWASQASAAFTT
jgi:hypothetical protein